MQVLQDGRTSRELVVEELDSLLGVVDQRMHAVARLGNEPHTYQALVFNQQVLVRRRTRCRTSDGQSLRALASLRQCGRGGSVGFLASRFRSGAVLPIVDEEPPRRQSSVRIITDGRVFARQQ